MDLETLSTHFGSPLTIETARRGSQWNAFIRRGDVTIFRATDYQSEQGAIDKAIAGLAEEKGVMVEQPNPEPTPGHPGTIAPPPKHPR